MSSRQPESSVSREQVKSTCAAHVCPECNTEHQVSLEQVVTGDRVITRCHCRACGHSWHPVLQPRAS